MRIGSTGRLGPIAAGLIVAALTLAIAPAGADAICRFVHDDVRPSAPTITPTNFTDAQTAPTGPFADFRFDTPGSHDVVGYEYAWNDTLPVHGCSHAGPQGQLVCGDPLDEPNIVRVSGPDLRLRLTPDPQVTGVRSYTYSTGGGQDERTVRARPNGTASVTVPLHDPGALIHVRSHSADGYESTASDEFIPGDPSPFSTAARPTRSSWRADLTSGRGRAST